MRAAAESGGEPQVAMRETMDELFDGDDPYRQLLYTATTLALANMPMRFAETENQGFQVEKRAVRAATIAHHLAYSDAPINFLIHHVTLPVVPPASMEVSRMALAYSQGVGACVVGDLPANLEPLVDSLHVSFRERKPHVPLQSFLSYDASN